MSLRSARSNLKKPVRTLYATQLASAFGSPQQELARTISLKHLKWNVSAECDAKNAWALIRIYSSNTKSTFTSNATKWKTSFTMNQWKNNAKCISEFSDGQWSWASRGGTEEGQAPPGFWKCQQTKVVFSVSSRKKQISPLLVHLEKFL